MTKLNHILVAIHSFTFESVFGQQLQHLATTTTQIQDISRNTVKIRQIHEKTLFYIFYISAKDIFIFEVIDSERTIAIKIEGFCLPPYFNKIRGFSREFM